MLLSFSFSRLKNWVMKRLNNLTKVTISCAKSGFKPSLAPKIKLFSGNNFAFESMYMPFLRSPFPSSFFCFLFLYLIPCHVPQWFSNELITGFQIIHIFRVRHSYYSGIFLSLESWKFISIKEDVLAHITGV